MEVMAKAYLRSSPITTAFPEGMPVAKAGVNGDHLGWALALNWRKVINLIT